MRFSLSSPPIFAGFYVCFFPRFCLFDGSCAVGLRAFFLTFFCFVSEDLGLMTGLELFICHFLAPMGFSGLSPLFFAGDLLEFLSCVLFVRWKLPSWFIYVFLLGFFCFL